MPGLHEYDDQGIGPSQHYHANRSSMLQRPEYRLMLSVLEDAIGCYDRWMRFGAPPAPVTPESLTEWFASEDTGYLYSFRSVCFHLDIRPEVVLARLAEIEQAAATGDPCQPFGAAA